MRVTQSLPSASPRTVVRIVLELLSADKETVFTQNTLKEMGVSQNRQALAFLRFMKLLTSSGGLRNDVLDNRDHPDRLTALLRDRLVTGCEHLGCDTAAVQELGTEKLTEREVDDLVGSLPPVQSRGNKSVVSNIVSCMKTIHSILACNCQREFLERESKRFEARRWRSSTSKAERRPSGTSMPPQTALPRGSEFSVSGPSIQNRVVTREQSIEAVDSPTCRPKVNFAGLVTESFVIGFDGNAPVYGEVTFPAELDGDQLERVAVQLLNLARAKQGRPIPSTHAFSPTS